MKSRCPLRDIAYASLLLLALFPCDYGASWFRTPLPFLNATFWTDDLVSAAALKMQTLTAIVHRTIHIGAIGGAVLKMASVARRLDQRAGGALGSGKSEVVFSIRKRNRATR
jgi:hypothetical protein